ncbi:MAG: hypothetical protein WCQ67_09510, partial [Treponema sp.]
GSQSVHWAAAKLNRSVKTIKRYVSRIMQNPEDDLIHKNRGRTPKNKADHETIWRLYKEKYAEADFNFVVPVLFYGGGLTGVGFSPKFEAGYNWDGWLLGLRYSYSTSLKGSTSLTSNIDIYKNSITLQISKTIDK